MDTKITKIVLSDGNVIHLNHEKNTLSVECVTVAKDYGKAFLLGKEGVLKVLAINTRTVEVLPAELMRQITGISLANISPQPNYIEAALAIVPGQFDVEVPLTPPVHEILETELYPINGVLWLGPYYQRIKLVFLLTVSHWGQAGWQLQVADLIKEEFQTLLKHIQLSLIEEGSDKKKHETKLTVTPIKIATDGRCFIEDDYLNRGNARKNIVTKKFTLKVSLK